MSLLDTLVRLVAPAPVAKALDVAEQLPHAVEAARLAWDAGKGPVGALRAMAVETDGALDDQAVAQLEVWVQQALTGCDLACRAGVALSAREPQVRAAIDTTLAAAFGLAYRAAAWRNTIERWTSAPGL